jgi:hypothetical protein
MTTAVLEATDKQLVWLKTLVSEKDLSGLNDNLRDSAKKVSGGWSVSRTEASQLIDSLKSAPRVAVPAKNTGIFAGLPLSKYAVERDGVVEFYEIREYKSTTYMRLLVGAPGDWNRVKVGYDRQKEVASLIRAAGATEAAKKYADEHGICAVCEAKLSDELSRARGIGPICWARFN